MEPPDLGEHSGAVRLGLETVMFLQDSVRRVVAGNDRQFCGLSYDPRKLLRQCMPGLAIRAQTLHPDAMRSPPKSVRKKAEVYVAVSVAFESIWTKFQ